MSSQCVSQGEVPGKGQEAGADSTNSPSRGSQTRQKKQRRVEQKGKKAKKKTAAQTRGNKRVAYSNGPHLQNHMGEG